MRPLVPFIVAANVLSSLAVPTTRQVARENSRFFDIAKAIIAEVDVLTGNAGSGVLGAVEAAAERVWKGTGERKQRAQVSIVETNGVRCEYAPQ